MPPATIHTTFQEDHARLAQELRAVLDTVETAEYPDIQARWARFDSGLRAHFDAEERFVLPVVEPTHPAAAAQTRADHARLRRRLTDLGVSCDLHALRLDEVEDLVTALVEHAAWEDVHLYPTADRALDAPTVRAAIAWLGERARRLLDRRDDDRATLH